MFARQAEATATRTQRADYRRAAQLLEREAARARTAADAARRRQAKRRGQVTELADDTAIATQSRPAPCDTGSTWRATARSSTSVTLRKVR